jgi:hypothetical protein
MGGCRSSGTDTTNVVLSLKLVRHRPADRRENTADIASALMQHAAQFDAPVKQAYATAPTHAQASPNAPTALPHLGQLG